ncbi:MAG: hypothetical protein V2J02_18775 [Pseudomonadales bacterium]|jgi:hypothetical protein|nr:hypothetical protein [Pseudomonadales bacterium]
MSTGPVSLHVAGPAPIDRVLARLDGVRSTRDGEWRAFSPFQEHRRARTLAVKECGDGSVLLHDFAGRDTREVLQALGLELTDLFPPRPGPRSTIRHRRWTPRLSARDALDALSREGWVLLIFGRRAVRFEATHEDWLRARVAVEQIERLRSAVR